MRGLNLLLSILMVVGVAFSIAGPVQADTPIPETEFGEGPDLSSSTLAPDDFTPTEELFLPDVSAPYPLSPSGSKYVFNLTPKLYFARNLAATEYKISMYDFRTDLTLFYTFIGGTDNCRTGYCWLQPPKKLKPYKYDATTGGNYAWKVEAKIGGSWVPNEVYATFFILSKGFTSTFTYDTLGWSAVNGTWKRTATGLYKTPGILGTQVNTWRKEYFTNNMVIEARVKRKVETGSSTRIYFFGYPELFGNNFWKDGYCFFYYDDGIWEISRYISGAKTTLAIASTDYAEINDWNTFKIWVHDDYISLWINDIFITSVYDTSRTGGAVGLAMYEGNPDKSPLLVDYVKVYYSAVDPFGIPEGSKVSPAPMDEKTNIEDRIIE